MASDLISREALLEAMDERYKGIESEKQYPFASDEERGLTTGFCEVDELVNNQPTVDAVEVVHGEWERISDRPKTYIRRCTVCNRDSYICFSERNYNYCPWCGAKMDGGGKE